MAKKNKIEDYSFNEKKDEVIGRIYPRKMRRVDWKKVNDLCDSMSYDQKKKMEVELKKESDKVYHSVFASFFMYAFTVVLFLFVFYVIMFTK